MIILSVFVINFGSPGYIEICVQKLCYLFTQGGQASSCLCFLVSIFNTTLQGVIHQIERLRARLDNSYYAVRAVDNDTECLPLSAAKPKGSPGTSFQVMA